MNKKLLIPILFLFVILIAGSASAFTGLCYQEQADASTATDGNCTLNYGGVYTKSASGILNPTYAYDANWSTAAEATGSTVYIYPKYLIPSGAVNATLTYQHNITQTKQNISVPDTCFGKYDPTFVWFRFTLNKGSNYVLIDCVDSGGGWLNIVPLTNGYYSLTEEAITWFIDYTPTTTSSSTDPTGTAFSNENIEGYCQATDSDTSLIGYDWTWYKDGVATFGGQTAGTCEQESANISTICGGLNTGSYYYAAGDIPEVYNATDGDWDTYFEVATVSSFTNYFQYTIPEGAVGASVKYKINSSENGTVVYPCTFSGSVKVFYGVDNTTGTQKISLYCTAGGIQSLLDEVEGDGLYEEAIIWDYGTPDITQGVNTNINNLSSSETSFGDEWLLSCRAYDGTSYSSWLNSSVVSIIDANITLGATQAVSNNTLTGVEFWYDNGTQITNPWYPVAGNYNITVNKTGYYNLTEEITISLGQTGFVYLEGMYNNLLNITAINGFNSSTIDSWSGTLTEPTYSYSFSYNATGGAEIVPTIQGLTYTSTVDATGYATDVETSTPASTTTNLQHTLYTSNSMRFEIYDVNTGNPITASVNLTMTSPNITYTASFSGGSYNKEGMLAGTYTIKAESSGYEDATVFSTILDDFQLVKIYMDSTPLDDVTFYIVDNVGDYVQDAVITLTLNINGTVVTVAQKETDLSGSATFPLDSTKEYGVVVTKTGYNTFTGNIVPTQSSYTINLNSLGSEIFISMNEHFAYSLNLLYTAGSGYAMLYYDLVSDNGALEYYGMTATYNGTTYTQNVTGVAGGGTVYFNVTINATTTQYLNATYWFKLQGYDYMEFSEAYLMILDQSANATLTNGAFSSEGMGLSTKAFIGMVIILSFVLFGFLVSRNLTVAMITGMVGVGITWFKDFLPPAYCFLTLAAITVAIIVDNMNRG